MMASHWKFIRQKINTFIAVWIIFTSNFPSNVVGQNFGGVPPGESWMIKSAENFDIIYPEKVGPIADSVAHYIQWINQNDPFSLGSERRKIPIILRNKSLTTNGFVAYVPYRSELFLFGAQNPNVLGFYDWMKLLSLHEYRHVIQYSNLNRGITRLTGRLLGHAAQAGVYNILVPNWFTEGEAVFYESHVTQSGRAQLPAFSAQLRALLLEDIKYSYQKYRNGSFKDLVPNHYVHGHLLTSYGHAIYGANFWSDVLDQTSRIKGLFWPFHQAIRRQTNHPLPDFHRRAIDAYHTQLVQQVDTSTAMPSFYFSKDHAIKDEIQLLTNEDGRIFLLESGYDEITTVYEITEKGKRKLFALGRTFDPYMVLRGQRILFTNSGYDARWTNREFSDIYYYDLDAQSIHRVSKNKKYLAVDYQPATQRYLAVQAGENGQNVIVTFISGEETVDTVLNNPSTYYSYPRWLDDQSDRFVFTFREKGTMTMAVHDLSTKTTEKIAGPVKSTIARPYPTAHGIYFSSSLSGIDQIYFYDFATGSQSAVTSDINGAYNPSVSIPASADAAVNLYYSSTTAYGHRIRIQKIDMDKAIRSYQVPGLSVIFSPASELSSPLRDEQKDIEILKAEPYKPGRHLFRFHSLLLEPSMTVPRLSYLSNDYLNTTRANVFIQYRDADQSWESGAEMTYGGWFPEITLGSSWRFNRYLNLALDQDIIRLPKTETTAQIGIAFPFNFSRRQFGHFLRLNTRYLLTREHFDQNDPVLPGPITLVPRNFQTLQFSADWSFTRNRAFRDILPKWGTTQYYLAKRGVSPADSWLIYANQNFYVPGFFQNDGFKFRWQGQWNSTFARDFLPFELNSLHDLPIDYSAFRSGAVLTANYLFPLAYPEISIPHVIYTKRVAFNLFTEQFLSSSTHKTWSGADLFLTAKYFNIIELTGGIRISRAWRNSEGPWSWSLVFLQDL